ncbi:hypothetical protein HYH02_003676 [Chlamydomonas schloesseri]|uniref:Transmembrane protein n=1 Tax=Chlamydomonas schloesseri TaxID=2026947 RepID=A0A835WQS2_9CHLO|nr:hypothetical protein HYH02_003676 [Chlamydomonas schloesseri]|eukprot:KAG2451901.1 hypothetical protein HYH02_003676 [Chlamydomonas schloesseri]
MASNDYSDTVPCNYLYAVGALGIFVSSLTMCFAPCPGGMIASIISGIFHIVWWAVSGWYFTGKYNDATSYPRSNYRHAAMALCWTNLAFGCIQFLMAIAGTFKGRGRGDDYEEKEEKHHKHEEKSHAEMTDQNPPPPLANPYPAPPPANPYPYPAPPPPANL